MRHSLVCHCHWANHLRPFFQSSLQPARLLPTPSITGSLNFSLHVLKLHTNLQFHLCFGFHHSWVSSYNFFHDQYFYFSFSFLNFSSPLLNSCSSRNSSCLTAAFFPPTSVDCLQEEKEITFYLAGTTTHQQERRASAKLEASI